MRNAVHDFGERGTGRGVANMRQRAGMIGGALEIQSSAYGTSLTLQVPLAPPK